MPRLIASVLCSLAALGSLPVAAGAQTAENVLVVINDQSPASVQVGTHYAARRAVPASNVVRIKAPVAETIQRSEYERLVESPIAIWLYRHALLDQVLYIVLTKGVPIRIAGPAGRESSTASVDSELTLLYRKLVGSPVPAVGRVANPYFLADRPVSAMKPFTRHEADTYLVTRLDAFSVEEAMALVDRGVSPSTDGKVVLDQRATIVDRGGDAWLRQTADRLQADPTADVLLEQTRAVAATSGPVLGYYSWGSNDASNRLRRLPYQFANGAIAGMFVSTDGRTFTEPPVEWIPGDSDRPPGLFGSGSQSLAGDLVRSGLSGVSAHVSEPYLDATVRPQILFPAYFRGATLGEAFYLATPYLSWQGLVLGDPLCTPFPRTPLAQTALHQGIDPETGLPALFAARRLALLGQTGMNPEALKLKLKAEIQFARGDRSSGILLLERATELEPRLVAAHFKLAGEYDRQKDYKKAVDRYRTILTLDPQHALASNNLAYTLAVHLGDPKEALPLAQRAYAVAPGTAVADTLAWIHYLLGETAAALPLIQQALAGGGGNADIQLHAAFIFAEHGDTAKAAAALDTATRLDPSIDDRVEVRLLRERLKSPRLTLAGFEDGLEARLAVTGR